MVASLTDNNILIFILVQELCASEYGSKHNSYNNNN